MRLVVLATALAFAGCGDDEPQSTAVSAQSTATTTTTTATEAEAPPGDPRRTALEQSAEQTVRDYVDALDARDGAAVCDLFAPDALTPVKLPEPGDDCAASVAASIGYRDPRGLPVWKHATLEHMRVNQLADDGESAQVVATVVTTFADRDELSTEDDVVYLTRSGGHWLVAKPSATFYRAIGVGDIPATVLAPPSG